MGKAVIARFLFVLWGVCLAWGVVHATVVIDDTEPVKLMQSISDQLIASLETHQEELKTNANLVCDLIHAVVIPYIDEVAMIKLVLGRQGYQEFKQANPEQQARFSALLTNLIVVTYASALQAYSDQKAVVYPPLHGDPDQHRVILKSKILNQDGSAINMIYVLSAVDEGRHWRIVDFSVEGVSLVQSYRSQFAPLLNQGGLDLLVATLAKRDSASTALPSGSS